MKALLHLFFCAAAAGAQVPADPFPISAAGWGPRTANGLFASRWAEDWTAARAAGTAPALKAMPLGGGTSLTLSGEARAFYQNYDHDPAASEKFGQLWLRGVAGADLRLRPWARVYAEAATGRVENRRAAAAANQQNEASLQQLFAELKTERGGVLYGVMAGRQEFADAPRQLVGLADVGNVHLSWNGARLYVHGERARFGAFSFRATRLNSDAFDERVHWEEALHGVNFAFVLAPGAKEPAAVLEPFWLGSRNVLDERDTYGARLRASRGSAKLDWTAARQTGTTGSRVVEAWGFFGQQSVGLSERGWKPRACVRVDAASSGFSPLYASNQYLGWGRFLALSNLMLVTPGVTATPAKTVALTAEYGFATRFAENDSVYAGGMRAYRGTSSVAGNEVGGLLKLEAAWTPPGPFDLLAGFEHFSAGTALRRAGRPSASYGYAVATLRY